MKAILVAIVALFTISAHAQYFDRNLYDQQVALQAARTEQAQTMQTCKNIASSSQRLIEAKSKGVSAEELKANVVENLSKDATATPAVVAFMTAEVDEVFMIKSKDPRIVKSNLQLWCIQALPFYTD